MFTGVQEVKCCRFVLPRFVRLSVWYPLPLLCVQTSNPARGNLCGVAGFHDTRILFKE